MPSRLLAVLLPLGALLIVLGAKLALIDSMGSDVPINDQWTAEGSTLFQVEMHRGKIPLEHFFFPNSEHRPATERLWAYALYRLDGRQWDCRVQAVANLVFQAGTFLVLWWAAGSFVTGWRLAVARILTVVLCSLPASHENFTWGFQSQFLLGILCGLVHVLGTARAARPDGRWLLAQIAGLMGILSLASGLLSAVALVALALLERARGRSGAWWWATLLANGALLAFGVWFLTKLSGAPGHSGSVAEFLKAVVVLLSWPVKGGAWGLLSQVPLVVAAIYALRQPAGPGPAVRFLGLAGWFSLLVAALAYGRGGGTMNIAVRYFDMLVIGCWLNSLAVLWLWPARGMGGRAFWLATGLAACLLPMLGGLAYWNRPEAIHSTVVTMQFVRDRRDGAVRDFLTTNDPAVFQRESWMTSTFPHLPYTIELLRDPLMRPVLPPSLQPDGRAGSLSRAALWITGQWRWLLALGVALLAAGGWHRARATT